MREADDEALRRASIFVDARETTVDVVGELTIPMENGDAHLTMPVITERETELVLELSSKPLNLVPDVSVSLYGTFEVMKIEKK